MLERLIEAAQEYERRREGTSEPAGIAKHTGYQEHYWVPDGSERRPCCLNTTVYLGKENALLQHCKSARHVAELYDVPHSDLWRMSRWVHVRHYDLGLLEQLWIAVTATEKIGGKELTDEQVDRMHGILWEDRDKAGKPAGS